EGALRRAAARAVERHVGMEQERNVVAARVEIALVNVNHVGKQIEIGEVGSVRGVHHLAVLPVGDAQHLVERLAVSKLYNRKIELAPGDEINRRTIAQALFGKHGNVRANEGNLDAGIDFLDLGRQQGIAAEAGGAGEQRQKLVILGDLDGLLRADAVRNRVKHA